MGKGLRSWWRVFQWPNPKQRQVFCRPCLDRLEDRCLLSGVNEFRIVPNAPLPVGITAGPDGALWFTESGAGKIGRITPAGAITEFTLPRADSDPEGIVTGPDGALWFTEFGIDRIGRITTAGAITEFPLALNSGPRGITASPGGLWFTEAAADRIGRISVAGVVTEFSTGITPGSTPTGITFGPDNNFWFTEANGDRVGRITPAGAVTEFSVGIAMGSQPTGIASGPAGDNALWFTMPGGNRVGRITTTGSVSITTGISPNSAPTGITLGPDDNLWFTENSGNRIGRVTSTGPTLGTVTEFSSGIVASSGLQGIAAGPDGNLWFAEAKANRIGQILSTGAGTVTEFRLRSGSSGPTDITLGPDAAVWFVDSQAAKIGRVSTTGAMSEFTLARSDSDPEGIATGPDGNLWFTEFGLDRIGRITPAGVITEFSLKPNTAPRGITTGPDGALWFTEQAADRLGRITTAGFVTNEFALSQGGNAESLTTGPDGALWITEPGIDKIARVTTTGTLTEFALAAGRTPAGITSGPASSNSVWFAESGANGIGRLTTTGALTEFMLPTAASRPLAIALGADGNFWFTENAANQIGRITPSGVVTEFHSGLTAKSGLRRITAGPNGTLWFSESQANRLGQVALLVASSVTINATEGQAFSGPVASFMDGDVRAVPGNYKVTITWGDGTPADTTTAVVSGSGGTFSISGMHTYADEGSFTVGVTIQDTIDTTASLASTMASSPAKVADAALTATSITANPVEGVAFTGAVASFTDANPGAAAKDFSATINWGDGQTSAGTIAAGSSGGFTVTGTHTYAEESTVPITVAITDVGGSTAMMSSSTKVADAALSIPPQTMLLPTIAEGSLFNGMVAAFTDANANAPASDFTATISWGDGQSSAGTVIAGSGGNFTVSGTHSFASEGSYAVAVQIRDVGGSTVTANSTRVVTDAPLVALAVPVPVPTGLVLTNVTVAAFTDTGGPDALGSYTATIDWGDQSSPTMGVISGANNLFSVSGSHTYSGAGKYPITVTIRSAGGSSIMASTSVLLGDVNQRYVILLYNDLFKRAPDSGGLAFWSNQLQQGTSRSQVAMAFLSSTEYRMLQVQGLYQTLLKRSPDPGGFASSLAFLMSGGTVEQLAAAIAGSPEYLQVRGGGTTNGFLSALYQDVLNRPIDPSGQATYSQALMNGATRMQVAMALYTSTEYRQLLVQSFYQMFLLRSADPAGLNGLVAALQNGARDEQLIASFLSSAEYGIVRVGG